MKFTDFNVVHSFFRTNENEKDHINYMRVRSNVWNGEFTPSDAASWLIVTRLNLGIRTHELAQNYIDEIECGIFQNFNEVLKDFSQLRISSPHLFKEF